MALMNLAFVPVYLKLLGVEVYGLVGFNVTLSAVLSLLDMGLSTTLNREMAKRSLEPERAAETRNLVRTMEVVYWPLALVIALVVAGLAPLIAHHWITKTTLPPATVQHAVTMMGLSIALQWPYSFYEGGLLGLQQQVAMNLVAIGAATARGLGSVCVLLWVAPTIFAFFTWQIVVNGVVTLVLCGLLWRKLPISAQRPQFQATLLHEVWKFAAGMTSISLVSLVLVQMDKIILSKLLPLRMFGYYSTADSVAKALYYGIGPFFTALFPRFVQMISQREEVSLASLYHRGCQFLAVVILPVAVVIIVFAYELMLLWTRNPVTATETHLLVSLLVAGTACNALMNLPYALQLASGWTKLAFYQNIVSILVMVPLLFWLTSRYGGVGAAVVWLLLNLSYLLFLIPLMHQRLLPGELRRWYLEDVGLPLGATLFVVLIGRFLLVRGVSPLGTLLQIGFLWGLTAFATACATPQPRAFLFLKLLRRPL